MNILIYHPCPICLTITLLGYLIYKIKKNEKNKRN